LFAGLVKAGPASERSLIRAGAHHDLDDRDGVDSLPERSAMPFINVKLIEGVFSSEQKRQMIERITDAMVSVEGERMRGLTTVVVEDNIKSGDWGAGGRAVTAEMTKDIQSGREKPPR
jgi:4-oxalocrotonate tautomerase